MNTQRSGWQGWVALVLAGLALFVAFGSRSSGFMDRQAMMNNYNQRNWSAQAPQAPVAPQAPSASDFQQVPSQGMNDATNYGRGHGRGMSDGMSNSQGMADRSMMMGMDRSQMMMSKRSSGGPFGFLGNILKLLGLATLAWLGIRFFSRRNQAPQAQPQPVAVQSDPTPPAPEAPRQHDPRVE